MDFLGGFRSSHVLSKTGIFTNTRYNICLYQGLFQVCSNHFHIIIEKALRALEAFIILIMVFIYK